MAVSGELCYSETMETKHESAVTQATFAAHKKTVNVVYLLRCSFNGKLYVGQTRQIFWKRWRGHRNAALCAAAQTYKQHTALAKAMRRYGPAAFDLIVLKVCERASDLDEVEAHWIERLGTMAPQGYNLAAGGKSACRAPEVGAAIAASNRGRAKTPEWRAKLRAAHLGKKLSPETRRRISEVQRGRKQSAESKAKRSAALKGRVNGPRSAETRAKISASLTGRTLSAERRARMSVERLGKKRSEETRRRMSESAFAREARKRAIRT